MRTWVSLLVFLFSLAIAGTVFLKVEESPSHAMTFRAPGNGDDGSFEYATFRNGKRTSVYTVESKTEGSRRTLDWRFQEPSRPTDQRKAILETPSNSPQVRLVQKMDAQRKGENLVTSRIEASGDQYQWIETSTGPGGTAEKHLTFTTPVSSAVADTDSFLHGVLDLADLKKGGLFSILAPDIGTDALPVFLVPQGTETLILPAGTFRASRYRVQVRSPWLPLLRDGWTMEIWVEDAPRALFLQYCSDTGDSIVFQKQVTGPNR